MAVALSELLALDEAERSAMGRRGREWMAAEFSWDGVAEQLEEGYRNHLSI
jgi:glycosyltransferase involved in cell wall biosynthesis